MRKFLWHCRNPFHNLFFYVIGIADKEFEIVGRFPGQDFQSRRRLELDGVQIQMAAIAIHFLQAR